MYRYEIEELFFDKIDLTNVTIAPLTNRLQTSNRNGRKSEYDVGGGWWSVRVRDEPAIRCRMINEIIVLFTLYRHLNINAVETITKTFDGCVKCCSPVLPAFVRFAPHNNKISESIKLQMSAHSNVLLRIKYARSVSLTRWKRECVRWQSKRERRRR